MEQKNSQVDQVGNCYIWIQEKILHTDNISTLLPYLKDEYPDLLVELVRLNVRNLIYKFYR